MKKSLLVLGVAVAALASCTNEEVTEVAQNRVIGFNSFVNNATKATDVETAGLTDFYVFGSYDNDASIVFSNTKVTGTNGGTYTPENTAYWQQDKSYTFAAYADGNGGQLTTTDKVSFANGTLSISNYSVDNTKDLIAATATATGPAAGSDQSVGLTFKHLLSKVKFTFTTKASPEGYRMEVSNLTFDGIKTGASCAFSNNTISTAWTGTNGDYTVATLDDYAVEGGSKATEEIFVIPQSNAAITASFTVTVYDEKTGTQIATNSYSNVSLAVPDDNLWTNGYAYNYTATINPDDVDDQLKPITFTVTEVDEWVPASDQPLTVN